MCYIETASGFGATVYKIISNPYHFTSDELALICDKRFLCFGYRQDGDNIVIYSTPNCTASQFEITNSFNYGAMPI